ncbi:MAG TPA: alpha/beta fold hydrolase [Burkholderiaceae bacterium]|nr:alpha/beta fold hydrolase [Burkholderiaceae bacterium]
MTRTAQAQPTSRADATESWAVLPATDGYPLAVTSFGDSTTARAAVLIVPGMGIKQEYYASFARWLASRKFFVLTFDYRGMGRSRPAEHAKSLRGFHADLSTWVERDCAAMVEYLHAVMDCRPVFWIGHSLGGQLLGLLPNHERITAAVTVGAGSGYWLENAARLRRSVWALWYVVAPIALKLHGYFPGTRLRMIGDLPDGVMRQWRRWCLHRHYAAGAEGERARAAYAQIRSPMFALSFSDDEFMSERGIASLHRLYVNAPKQFEHVDPRTAGLARIGHFGFFRAESKNALWHYVGAWLADPGRWLGSR